MNSKIRINQLFFGALVVGAILFWATSANAHCGGRHIGNHPHCADGGDPGGEEPSANPALAFTTLADDSIKLIDIDGSDLNQIFSKKVERGQWIWSLRWSPDGNKLAYLERNENSLFVIVNPDGSNPESFQPNLDGVELSPQKLFEWRNVDSSVQGSSARIFFLAAPSGSNSGHSAYWDIYTIDPAAGAGQNAHRITFTDNVERIAGFAVSPDGKKIVATYHVDSPYVDPDLLLYDLGVGTDGELMITGTSTITPSTTPTGSFSPYNMRWANTTDTIVYIDNNDLYALTPGGSSVTALEGGGSNLDIGCIRSPTWSPDDSKMAFDIQCGSKSYEGIRVADIGIDSATMQLSLTNIVQITTGIENGAVIDWLPSWTPMP